VQADPEHEQHDPDLGELGREVQVGDKPRGERPHRHTRQQIAEERWQAQAHGEEAAQKGNGQAHADGRNQRRAVGHRRSLLG
jgi:hypothetical protein